MNIYPVGNQTSFKSAIPINSKIIQNRSSRELDKQTVEIEKVLNSKKSILYSEEKAKTIRSFFKSVLGDYNGNNGVEFRKIPSSDVLVLLSGKDLNAIKNIEHSLQVQKRSITKSKNLSVKKKKQAILTLDSQIDNEIIRRLEDGNEKKPSSLLTFSMNRENSKITNIRYNYFKKYFTAIKDGFVDKTQKQTPKRTETNKAINIIYEEKMIDC